MSSAVAARNREQHTEGPEPLAPLDLGGFSMQVWSCSSSETQKQGSGFRGQGRAGLYSSGWGQTGRLLREAQCNLHLQVIASRKPEDTQMKWKVSWPQSPSLPTSLSGSDMDLLDHQFNRNKLRLSYWEYEGKRSGYSWVYIKIRHMAQNFIILCYIFSNIHNIVLYAGTC